MHSRLVRSKKQLRQNVFMTILINVQHEPSRCNTLCYVSDYGIHADTKLISHDSALSVVNILLRSDASFKALFYLFIYFFYSR